MKLEQEAAAFSKGKQTQFREGLTEGIKDLEQYIRDNLYNTSEKDEALKNLVEVNMWAERCASIHGIK